jgi:hypothetical protein
MVERLLLDRIDVECRDLAIDKIVQPPPTVFVDTTDTHLPLRKLAVMPTQLANDSIPLRAEKIAVWGFGYRSIGHVGLLLLIHEGHPQGEP